MTFNALETSQDQGRPFELLQFKYGSESDATFNYTNADTAISHQGQTFNPLTLRRGNMRVKANLDKTNLEIMVPRDSDIANLFKFRTPSYVVSLTIWLGHFGDDPTERPAIWTGRIVSVISDGSESRLVCQPSATSMRRVAMRWMYQLPCQHVLYSDNCKANRVAATRQTAVLGIGGSQVTLSPGWQGPFDRAKFRYGVLSYESPDNLEYRTILKVSGDTLTLGSPADELEAGGTVNITLGCNHWPEDCSDLHQNLVNYGGMPFIPMDTPIGKNNHHRS